MFRSVIASRTPNVIAACHNAALSKGVKEGDQRAATYDVSDEDRFSDGSSESWESEMSVDSSGSGSLMAFSSAFLARAEAVELVEISSSPPSPGPREEMFF